MHKMKMSPIFVSFIASLLFPLSVSADSGVQDIAITADYSSYCENADALPIASDIRAYAGTDTDSQLVFTDMETDQDHVTYHFEAAADVKDIYVVPPVIFHIQKEEPLKLSMYDGSMEKCELFTFHDIAEKADYHLHTDEVDREFSVHISSETNEYPDMLYLIRNGKTYSGTKSVQFSWNETIDQVSLSDVAFTYSFTENGIDPPEDQEDYFTCYKTGSYEYAEQASFSGPDELKINIIVPEILF